MDWRSYFHEVGNKDEHNPNCDEKNDVGNEIRENHEHQPTNEWRGRILLPAIDEESEPKGAKQQTKEQPRSAQNGLTYLLFLVSSLIPAAERVRVVRDAIEHLAMKRPVGHVVASQGFRPVTMWAGESKTTCPSVVT